MGLKTTLEVSRVGARRDRRRFAEPSKPLRVSRGIPPGSPQVPHSEGIPGWEGGHRGLSEPQSAQGADRFNSSLAHEQAKSFGAWSFALFTRGFTSRRRGRGWARRGRKRGSFPKIPRVGNGWPAELVEAPVAGEPSLDHVCEEVATPRAA